MRDKALNATVAFMVMCAVGTTGLTVWRTFAPPPRSAPLAPRPQRDWARYAADGHVLGNQTAPVTIVEFADFECSYCAQLKPLLDTILARHPSDVRIVFRHYPLASHRLAIQAAKVAECAAEQRRFAPMYDALYAHQDSMGIAPWTWFGDAAGVASETTFEHCLRSGKPFAALAQDTVAGGELGVTGTPTLLINQLRLDGVPSLDSLEAYIVRVRRASDPHD